MPYTAQKPDTNVDLARTRTAIEGWGVDLDPANRPGVPREVYAPQATGAHWEFPERQTPTFEREKSNEHQMLTPVFGTVCPLKGVSGVIRRYAYTFSEGRTAHWTLLVLADRVDVLESRVTALLRGRPDNPFAEAGLAAEVRRHGIRSRMNDRRVDVRHQPVDVLLYATKALLLAGALFGVGVAVTNARSRRHAWW